MSRPPFPDRTTPAGHVRVVVSELQQAARREGYAEGWRDGYDAYEGAATGGPSVRAWCVTWRTPRMPAPAFWYFGTLEAAREAADDLEAHATPAKVRELWLPADVADRVLSP